MSAFGAILRVVPPTPICNRNLSRLCQEDGQLQDWLHHQSLWSSFETQNWTPESIQNGQDIKKKMIVKMNDKVLSGQDIGLQVSENFSKACQGFWLLKL